MRDTTRAQRSAILAWSGSPAKVRALRDMDDEKLRAFVHRKLAAAFLAGLRRGRVTPPATTDAQRIREVLRKLNGASVPVIAKQCKISTKNVAAHLAMMRSRGIAGVKKAHGESSWALTAKGKSMA